MKHTKLKLNDGSIVNVVHGVFGEEAAKLVEESRGVTPVTKEEVEDLGGSEMLRYFPTPEECDAYKQGIEDMNGNSGYFFTSGVQHSNLYGFVGAAFATTEERRKSNIVHVRFAGIVLGAHYSSEDSGFSYYDAIERVAKKFEHHFSYVQDWQIFLDKPEHLKDAMGNNIEATDWEDFLVLWSEPLLNKSGVGRNK